MEQSLTILEFHTILNQLAEHALTTYGKEKALALRPLLSETEIIAAQRETSEARKILDAVGQPPTVSLEGTHELLTTAEKGGCLSAEQLEYLATTLTAVHRMKEFLKRCLYLNISLPSYELELDALDEIRALIKDTIRSGQVDDYASKLLLNLRRDIERTRTRMRNKAEELMRSHKDYYSDSFITIRNGRICLPVKKDYKFQVSGTIIDRSSTGATLFVEPTAIQKYNQELDSLLLEEENEVRRILYELTGYIADSVEIFRHNTSILEALDFIFAKGALSVSLRAREPKVHTERTIRITQGRHPLMDPAVCVPLDFSLGNDTRGVVITGPNTGGKTVAIKTVGLLCAMAQSGLHIPCESASIGMNTQILCDIGDGQNITENLSTFSSHILRVIHILQHCGPGSLVIMDELGSGTDPTEGMGIAIAILEELRSSGCLFLVTTHYPEVKSYAERTDHILNARMAFDRESLKPLYRLELGQSGESCAFYIAARLGMPGNMLRTASLAAYGQDTVSELAASDSIRRAASPSIKKQKAPSNRQKAARAFQLGDSVMIYPDKKIGIVCKTADDKGILQVQIAGRKIHINHKRVKLHVPASELYPEDYDFSILFDTVANRKARHQMEKQHRPDLTIRTDE